MEVECCRRPAIRRSKRRKCTRPLVRHVLFTPLPAQRCCRTHNGPEFLQIVVSIPVATWAHAPEPCRAGTSTLGGDDAMARYSATLDTCVQTTRQIAPLSTTSATAMEVTGAKNYSHRQWCLTCIAPHQPPCLRCEDNFHRTGGPRKRQSNKRLTETSPSHQNPVTVLLV